MSGELERGGDVVLGIDLATAGARCVAVDAGTGKVLAFATGPLAAPERLPGRGRMQAATYAVVALDLVGQVARQLGGRSTGIRALSVTGTSGTVVPVDATGVPVGDARLYDDLSGADVAAAHGLPLGSMLARMTTLLRVPGVRGLVPTVDVVAAALVGGPVSTDTSHALKAGIDLAGLRWPHDMMAALGLRDDIVSPLVHPGANLGTVTSAAASRLGLPSGVFVVAGMTDGCTAQLSTGAIHPGDSIGVLGTTLVLKGVADHDVRSADGAVYSHLSPGGAYWPGGASNSGAGVLLAAFPRLDAAGFIELDRRAAERGPATVVRYPLTRPGERFPVADPDLASLTSGEPVDEVEAYRAILEGVAFVERLGLETLAGLGAPTLRHTLAGGATRSAVWNTLRASVIGGSGVDLPVVRLPDGRLPEDRLPDVRLPVSGSAIGAAILAAHGLALTRDPAAALATTVDRLVAVAVDVVPDRRESEALEQSYHAFRALLTRHHTTHPTTAATPAEGSTHHA